MMHQHPPPPQTHPKRSKTPKKQSFKQQPTPNKPQHSHSPLFHKNHSSHASQPGPNLSSSTHNKPKPQIPLLNLNLNLKQLHQKCISPTLTAANSTNSNMNDKQSQHQISIKIALQLAQHHKKQSQVLKIRIHQYEQAINNMDAQINRLRQNNKILEEGKNKYQQKYRKIKFKYKDLKKVQNNQILIKQNIDNNQEQYQQKHQYQQQNRQQARNIRNGGNGYNNQAQQQQQSYSNTQFNTQHIPNSHYPYPYPYSQPQQIQQMQTSAYPSPQQQMECLHNQLALKNTTIHKLCQQIQQCEQNTTDILKLVNILQQKVQQLSMDNTLLKGMIREKQIQQQHSRQSTIHNQAYSINNNNNNNMNMNMNNNNMNMNINKTSKYRDRYQLTSPQQQQQHKYNQTIDIRDIHDRNIVNTTTTNYIQPQSQPSPKIYQRTTPKNTIAHCTMFNKQIQAQIN